MENSAESRAGVATDTTKQTPNDKSKQYPSLKYPATDLTMPQVSTPSRPRLTDSIYHYSSRLDITQGALRTTTDGNLLGEDTGDWLMLETPPHNEEDQEIAKQRDEKAAERPPISLPEAKNGATGLDNPRARKPLFRLLRNKLSGSDRPPAEKEDPKIKAKKQLHADMMQQ